MKHFHFTFMTTHIYQVSFSMQLDIAKVMTCLGLAKFVLFAGQLLAQKIINLWAIGLDDSVRMLCFVSAMQEM